MLLAMLLSPTTLVTYLKQQKQTAKYAERVPGNVIPSLVVPLELDVLRTFENGRHNYKHEQNMPCNEPGNHETCKRQIAEQLANIEIPDHFCQL